MATGHEFTNLADLASARVGGRAIATNDDFFAPKSNLVKPEPAIFIPGKYTSNGQVDGRLGIAPPPRPRPRLVHRRARHARHRARRQRRYQPLHRQLSVALLDRGGRHRRAASRPSMHAVEGAPWTTLLEKIGAARQRRQLLRDCRSPAVDASATEHLSRRRRRAPARLRRSRGGLDARRAGKSAWSISRRSRTAACSWMRAITHYGTRGALIMPGRAKNMGDGWETKRRRGPGSRLGDRAPRRTGRDLEGRDRHQSLQGQLSRSRVARRLPRAGRDASIVCARRRGRRSCPRRSCRRTSATIFSGKQLQHDRRRSRTCG